MPDPGDGADRDPLARAESSAHVRSRSACSSRHPARDTRARTRRSRWAASIRSLARARARRKISELEAALEGERRAEVSRQVRHHVGKLGAFGFDVTLCRIPEPGPEPGGTGNGQAT